MEQTKKPLRPQTQEKFDKIRALLKELDVELVAEEVMLPGNIIRKVVFYQDNEKYIEEEKITDLPPEQKPEKEIDPDA